MLEAFLSRSKKKGVYEGDLSNGILSSPEQAEIQAKPARNPWVIWAYTQEDSRITLQPISHFSPFCSFFQAEILEISLIYIKSVEFWPFS